MCAELRAEWRGNKTVKNPDVTEKQKTPAASTPASRSVEYVPVRCTVCHWQDGLRGDLIIAGDLRFYCDKCDDWTSCEPIPLNDKLSDGAGENR